MNKIKAIFLNERIVFIIIILNALIIFTQEMGVNPIWLNVLDILCTLFFLIEMIVKQLTWGFKGYWSDGWNRMDGVLVFISIPSIFAYVWPNVLSSFSIVLVLRLLRVFRTFRLVHLFPNFTQIMKNVGLALRQCVSIFVGFGILLFIFSLISCALFHNAAPDYFGTPLESFYSTFKMCTVEGWYEIPDAVTQGSPAWSTHLVRLYFIAFLVSMGLIGMSIINSIFVDAMVSDNNDEVIKELKELRNEIKKLKNDE